MELVIKLLTILAIGAVELLAAVPAGLAMQIHPVVTGVTASAGAILGALIIVLLGERARDLVMRFRGRKNKEEKNGRLHKIWSRYGIVGLGLLAPLLTGVPLAVALGVTFGAPTGRLVRWIALGVVLWSAVLTIGSVLGLASIKMLFG